MTTLGPVYAQGWFKPRFWVERVVRDLGVFCNFSRDLPRVKRGIPRNKEGWKLDWWWGEGWSRAEVTGWLIKTLVLKAGKYVNYCNYMSKMMGNNLGGRKGCIYSLEQPWKRPGTCSNSSQGVYVILWHFYQIWELGIFGLVTDLRHRSLSRLILHTGLLLAIFT